MRCVMLFVTLAFLDARADTFVLRAGLAEADPTSYLDFVLDPERRLTGDDFLRRPSPAANTVDTVEPNFGYQPGWVWLQLKVANPESETLTRILDFGVNFMDELDVFQETDGRLQTVMLSSSESVFSLRQFDYHELATELSFPPESETLLLIRYASRGGTTLPMKFFSQEAWAEHARYETTYAIATYVLLGSFALVACLAFALSPSRRVFFYALSLTLVIVYLAQVDGLAFQWLWPDSPAVNRLATPVLAALIALAYSAFCWSHLETAKNYPRINRFLVGLMVVQVCFIALAIQHVAYVVVVAAFSAAVVAGLAAYATYKEGMVQLPFMLGRWGFVTATFIIGFRELLNIEITYAVSIEVIRYAAIWEAAFLGLAIILFYRGLRNEHRLAQERQIAALEANLVMQDRFRQLESRAELASRIAESRSQQLADATHDLRQPMYSLRLAIRKLMEQRRLDTESLEAVSKNFTYLEDLVDQYLDSGLDDMSDFDPAEEAQEETYPVSVIFDATREMFANEAKEKGVALHVRSSDTVAPGSPVMMLRIVNNFVSNAIKYCGMGDHVLVGLRRFNGKRYVAVYDTGPGMQADELAAIEERRRRGDQADSHPEGKGIGLSIVASLAEQCDLDWIVRSVPGRGSLFAVELDAAI